MAQFVYYGTWKDSLQIIGHLADLKRFTFIIDMPYSSTVPYQFSNLSPDILDILEKYHRLFLWSEEYSMFSLDFGKPFKGGTYRIETQSSGPVLDLTLPRCVPFSDKQRFVWGMLYYEKYYYNRETSEWIKPPEVLKRVYLEVSRLIKKELEVRYMPVTRLTTLGNYKPGAEKLWIGRNGVKLLDEDKAGIQVGSDTLVTGKMMSRSRKDVKTDDYWIDEKQI